MLVSILTAYQVLDPERLDDVPAAATPLGVPGSATGRLDGIGDLHDYYRISLTAGRGVILSLEGSGELDLRLLGPDAATVGESGPVVGASRTLGPAEFIAISLRAPGTTLSTFLSRLGVANTA